jgi:hypothetical protein
MILLLWAACSGGIVLDDTSADTEVALDDTSVGDTEDTELDEDHPARGSYEGPLDLVIVEAGVGFCTTVIELFIDGAGALESEGVCQPDEGPQGVPPALPFAFEGTVDGSGDIEGTLTYEVDSPEGAESREAEFEGVVGGDQMELTFEMAMPNPQGEMTLQGTVTAEHD